MMDAFQTGWIGTLKYLVLVWMMVFKIGAASTRKAVATKHTFNGTRYFRCEILDSTLRVYDYGSYQGMMRNSPKEVATVNLSETIFVSIPGRRGRQSRKPQTSTIQLIPADVDTNPIRLQGRGLVEKLFDYKRFELNFKMQDQRFLEAMRAKCAAQTRPDYNEAVCGEFRRLKIKRPTMEFWTFKPEISKGRVEYARYKLVVIEWNNRAWNKTHFVRMNTFKPKSQPESQSGNTKPERQEVVKERLVDDVETKSRVDSESRVHRERRERKMWEEQQRMQEEERKRRELEARVRSQRHREAEEADRVRFLEKIAAMPTPKKRKRNRAPRRRRRGLKFPKPSEIALTAVVSGTTSLLGAATIGVP